MPKELKSKCCGAKIYPMVPYSGSTPYCMKCQQPCYPAIDEILAEPQGGEGKNRCKCAGGELCEYQFAINLEDECLCECHSADSPVKPKGGQEKCSCGEPHISNRIVHRTDALCYVKHFEPIRWEAKTTYEKQVELQEKANEAIIDAMNALPSPGELPRPENFTSPEIEKAIDEIISATPGATVPPPSPEKGVPCHEDLFSHRNKLCRCFPPPHKEEDWAGEFEKHYETAKSNGYAENEYPSREVMEGEKEDKQSFKDWIRIKKAEWEARARGNHPNCYADKAEVDFKIAAARAEGCERGKAEAKQFLDEMVIKLDDARAEAVRQERERIRGCIARLATVEHSGYRMISEANLLDLLEPNSDIHQSP